MVEQYIQLLSFWSGRCSCCQCKNQSVTIDLERKNPIHTYCMVATSCQGVRHTWLLSSGQDFGKKFSDSKQVYLKPSRIFFFIFTTLLCAGPAQNPPLNQGKNWFLCRESQIFNQLLLVSIEMEVNRSRIWLDWHRFFYKKWNRIPH